MSEAEGAIAAALAKCAVAVDRVGHGRWTFTLSNGTDLAARARIDDGWLLLDASLGPGSVTPARVWQLLRWNVMLAGGARFAVPPDRPGMRACAEVPLEEGIDLRRRVLDACAGLAAASDRLGGGPDESDDAMPGAARDGEDGDLSDLCLESGWACVARETGRLAVDLDVPGAFQQAVVEGRGRGVAVTVPVAETAGDAAEPPASICEQALGLLLVRVCGIVRMARAAAEVRDGIPRARFEVVFGSRPCAAELAHAFAALSVACRIAGREAAVLRSDEKVAGAYLAQWDRNKEDHDGADGDDDTGAPGE
jgi:hypothetical protein